MSPAVPDRYRGVWARTLLQTPAARDDSSWVRWLQTAHWHGDLRVPVGAAPARQQGFSGITTVEAGETGEVCAWHREVDFQPPRPDPDAGHVVFEGPDRLIETGVHADYLEVWQRLPDSSGRFIVLETDTRCRLLVAGAWAMRVRPRRAAWPADLAAADTLHDLVLRHPAQAPGWLDFEISFGRLAAGRWTIEQSTLPALRGTELACSIHRVSEGAAELRDAAGGSTWRVAEWISGDADIVN